MKDDIKTSYENTRSNRELDMGQPVWTVRHIARLFDVSVAHATRYIIKTPGFPAPRQCKIGPKQSVSLNKTYKRDEVLTWHERQPVVTEKSA